MKGRGERTFSFLTWNSVIRQGIHHVDGFIAKSGPLAGDSGLHCASETMGRRMAQIGAFHAAGGI